MTEQRRGGDEGLKGFILEAAPDRSESSESEGNQAEFQARIAIYLFVCEGTEKLSAALAEQDFHPENEWEQQTVIEYLDNIQELLNLPREELIHCRSKLNEAAAVLRQLRNLAWPMKARLSHRIDGVLKKIKVVFWR